MKTWFCKDTQKWVSDIPRAFWLGVFDYQTGEMIFSDDDYEYSYKDDENKNRSWYFQRGIKDSRDFYGSNGNYCGPIIYRTYELIFKKKKDEQRILRKAVKNK